MGKIFRALGLANHSMRKETMRMYEENIHPGHLLAIALALDF
jgi:hypothetical protein